jgi:hypothetical protein
MSHELPVTDSLKVYSRFTPVREIRIPFQCLIPRETLLRNQFNIHLNMSSWKLRQPGGGGVYTNLYSIEYPESSKNLRRDF